MTGSFRIRALVSSNRSRSATPSHTAADDAPASRRCPGGGLLSLPLRRQPRTRALPACPSPASSPSCATPSRREPAIPQISRSTIAPPSAISMRAAGNRRERSGQAIRAAGATVDRVVTSQWCRCRDTARYLDLGPVEDLPALNSFFRNRDRAGPQTAELRQFLRRLPPAENRHPGHPSGEHHGAHGPGPRLGRGLPAKDRARRHDLRGRRDPDRPLALSSIRPESRSCLLGRNGRGQRNEACPEPGPPKYTTRDLRHSCASYPYTLLLLLNHFVSSLIPSSNSHRIQSNS